MIRNKINSLINKERGFTIVELLIVIVVIGILAAITIVSYTGITAQATLAKYKQDSSSIVSVAEVIYNSSASAYPQTAAAFTSTTAKLPGNVAVNATPLTAAPTSVSNATPSGTTTLTYAWWPCGAGINVYYPDPAVTTTATSGTIGVAVAKAGAGCS